MCYSIHYAATEGSAEQEGIVSEREPTKRRQTPKDRLPLTDDRSWDVQDVAYFLNISDSMVRNLERDGELPSLPRIGTRIIFDPKVVRAFRDGWRPPKIGGGGRRAAAPPMLVPEPR
jgi:hypothetical protein